MTFIGLGYLSMYLLYVEILDYSYSIIFLSGLSIGIGSSTTFLCSLTAGVSHTKEKIRAVAVGILVGTFGFSSFVFAMIHKHILLNDYEKLFLLVLILSVICNFIAIIFVYPPNISDEKPLLSNIEEEERQHHTQQAVLSAIIINKGKAKDDEIDFSPSIHVSSQKNNDLNRLEPISRKNEGTNFTNFNPSQNEDAFPIADSAAEFENLLERKRTKAFTLASCLSSRRFLATATIAMVCTLASLTVVSNPGSINKSFFLWKSDPENSTNFNGQAFRDMIDSKNASVVGYIGIGNTMGRLVFGLLADITFNKWRVGRGFWLAMVPILMGLGTLGIVFSESFNSLAASEVLCLFAHGAFFTVLGTFLSEQYPFRFYPTMYGVTMAGPAIGGSVGNLMFGRYADARAVVDPLRENHTICNVQECYSITFLFFFLLIAIFGIPCAWYVFWRDFQDRKHGLESLADFESDSMVVSVFEDEIVRGAAADGMAPVDVFEMKKKGWSTENQEREDQKKFKNIIV
eukprot:GDKJ01026019.1.p1 GENE.GDKJ01026019.1~~GDKJ01026019.1.p1  ORF type:complete len:603 (-),score=101.70 GDKJ01026019.1:262-1809(-)